MKQQASCRQRRRLERVVVLVDVKAVVEQDNRRICAAHIFNVVSSLLGRCNEQNGSSTLWGYSLFDSSRSPLTSKSIIGRLLAGQPSREQFDAVSLNLDKFGQVLDVLVAADDGYKSGGRSKGECLVRTLAAVASDFPWDPPFASDSSSSDEEKRSPSQGRSCGGDEEDIKPQPNLVVLFSCVPTCQSQFATFLDSELQLERSSSDEELILEFQSRFRHVQALFESKNIQCCWIDVPVKHKPINYGMSEKLMKLKAVHSFARRCLIGLAWTLVSLSLVAHSLNSGLSRLIWNMMVCSTSNVFPRSVPPTCKAHISYPTFRFRRSLRNQSTLFAVDVQPWINPLTCDYNIRDNIRLPRLFSTKEPLKRTKLLGTSDKLEIVILSKFSARNTLKLSTERYIVQQNLFGASISWTGESNILGHRLGEFKQGSPSWSVFLVSLAMEESVALVTVNHEDHSSEAVLEPFTLDFAILTILDNSLPSLGRKRPPTRLSCHLSKISKLLLREEFKVSEKENSKVSSTCPDIEESGESESRKPVNPFEDSFDKKLLTVVKEKRRGCVLFRSQKKQKLDSGKVLDPCHDCFQGSSAEVERVSWQVYWQRVAKLYPQEEVQHEFPCTARRSIAGNSAAADLRNVEDLLQFMDGLPFTETTSGALVPAFVPGSPERECELATKFSLEEIPDQACTATSMSSRQLVVEDKLLWTHSVIPEEAGPTNLLQAVSQSTHDRGHVKSERMFSSNSETHGGSTSVSFEQEARGTTTSIGPECKAEVDVKTYEDATRYISSLEQLIRKSVSSRNLDLQQFAKVLVAQSLRSTQLVHGDRENYKESFAREGDLSRCTDTLTASRLKKLLLKKPKQLLAKYKKILASEATTVSCKAAVLEEKFREHELQILFRLEIFLLEVDKEKQQCLVEEVCKLLDSIQFHLADGDSTGESFLQYFHRVISSRYKGLLPSTIDKIFSAMELNGYCDPSVCSTLSEDSKTQVNLGLVVPHTSLANTTVPQLAYEASGTPSEGPDMSTTGQEKGSSADNGSCSNDADCKVLYNSEVIAPVSNKSYGKENVLIVKSPDSSHKQEKRQKKRNSYHFSSGALNLLRVKAIKPRKHSTCTKSSHKINKVCRSLASRISGQDIRVLADGSIPVFPKEAPVPQGYERPIQVVCQTPLPQAKASLPGNGRRGVHVVCQTPLRQASTNCLRLRGKLDV